MQLLEKATNFIRVQKNQQNQPQGATFNEMKNKESHVNGPFNSFGQRCSRKVRELRVRFYIIRKCVRMLVCWKDIE
ncbi:hypothetical protein MtrunA17_Chr1g0169911 [Medicago truncatula]|uniref:DVL family protein n=1 Tax=Medicago truncatula TaxID=3880 RepID=G7ZXT1_MEDTR|nr:DVL family protein [Medicago truncatula]RHN78802.1 hypothetical protein MtrunA17_Chr1g0169911 [Medicago truncatula]